MQDFSYLKQGDDVFISDRWNDRLILTKVTRLTPTGRINVANGTVFLPDGTQFGSGYRRDRLKPYNDEFKALYERQQTIIRAKGYICEIEKYRNGLEKIDGEVLAETVLNLEKISVMLKEGNNAR